MDRAECSKVNRQDRDEQGGGRGIQGRCSEQVTLNLGHLKDWQQGAGRGFRGKRDSCAKALCGTCDPN